MANKERYPGQRSEYGGGDGSPQLMPDGSFIDLSGVASGVGRRARLMRTAGLNDYDAGRTDVVGAAATALEIGNMSAAQLAAYQKDMALSAARAEERARLNAQTNGYIDGAPEVGEAGEGNGVKGLGA